MISVIATPKTTIAQEDDDDAISFDVGPASGKPSGAESAFEFKSLSMGDLQAMVDSEIRDVSNVIGLEVRCHSQLGMD